MNDERVAVQGADWRGTMLDPGELEEGRPVRVRLDDGRIVMISASSLAREGDGHFSVPLHLSRIEATQPDEYVVPVIEERLHVEKHVEKTGTLRVRKRVHSREEQIDHPLLREDVEVERVAVNRVVDEPPPIRMDGDHVVIPILQEVLVVEKRLLLKEELHVRKRRSVEREPQRVVLREEEALVERASESGS